MNEAIIAQEHWEIGSNSIVDHIDNAREPTNTPVRESKNNSLNQCQENFEDNLKLVKSKTRSKN